MKELKTQVILITLLMINTITGFSQMKVGTPYGSAPSVTLIKDSGDDNYVIYKDGRKESLAAGILQVNFGFKLINTPKVIKTPDVKKIKYGEHIFIATPRKNGKTKFKEIVMFNDNYYMTTVRGAFSVTVTVYDRKTNKAVKGRAGKGFEIRHKGTQLKGSEVKLSKAVIKGMKKSVELLKISTYFPNCGDIETQMLKKAEVGENVLSDLMYKNCNNSKDLYSSWYKN